MTDRLPWRRHPDGYFEAYPKGEDRPRFSARIRFDGSHPKESGQWLWSVTIQPKPPYAPAEVVARFGYAESKQAAADAATAAWPDALKEARQRGLDS